MELEKGTPVASEDVARYPVAQYWQFPARVPEEVAAEFTRLIGAISEYLLGEKSEKAKSVRINY